MHQGILGAPSRLLQSGAPLLFGLVVDAFGAVTSLSTSLTLLALAALLGLRPAPGAAERPA